MGIRCYCPNGHRLNIKAFLAGRVGVCPQCQATFRIPTESEPLKTAATGQPAESSQPPGQNGSGGAHATPEPALAAADYVAPEVQPGTQQPVAQEPVAQQPVAQEPVAQQPVAQQPVAQQPVAQEPAAQQPVAQQPSQEPAAQQPPATPMTAAPLDPISESPNAVWYVRPPTGGEFGPAKGDIMRKWVSEGRVTPDSLVWREGWPDWRLADGLFPNL